MPEDDLLRTATALRRGVIRLGRRLRMERPEPTVPLLQLSLLGLLNARGPLTAGALASAERVQPQSLTRTLAALETAALVSRGADPQDRRRSLLEITQAGRQVLRDDIRQRDGWLALVMADQLTHTERELLCLAGELMERLAEADATALHRPASSTMAKAAIRPDENMTRHPQQQGNDALAAPGP